MLSSSDISSGSCLQRCIRLGVGRAGLPSRSVSVLELIAQRAAPWDPSVCPQWEHGMAHVRAQGGTWHRMALGLAMRSQLVPIITKNSYCDTNSQVYNGLQSTGKSLLFYRMFHTTQAAQGPQDARE